MFWRNADGNICEFEIPIVQLNNNVTSTTPTHEITNIKTVIKQEKMQSRNSIQLHTAFLYTNYKGNGIIYALHKRQHRIKVC